MACVDWPDNSSILFESLFGMTRIFIKIVWWIVSKYQIFIKIVWWLVLNDPQCSAKVKYQSWPGSVNNQDQNQRKKLSLCGFELATLGRPSKCEPPDPLLKCQPAYLTKIKIKIGAKRWPFVDSNLQPTEHKPNRRIIRRTGLNKTQGWKVAKND